MNIIISPLERTYNAAYQVYTTIKDASSFSGTIEYLIYNEALDEDNLDLVMLINIFQRADHVLYIKNDIAQNPLIALFTIAKRGYVLTDEMFLMNTTSLNFLIENPLKSLNKQTNSESIIEVLIGKINNNENLSVNYLDMTKEALKGMLEESKNAQTTLINLCETAFNLIDNQLKNVKQDIPTPIIEQSTKEEKQVEPMDLNKIDSTNNTESSWSMVKDKSFGEGFQQSELIFTKKSYNVFLVKDPEHTRFMLSFLAGLQHYMTVGLKLKTQLVIIENSGIFAQEKYKDYTWVNATNYNELNKFIKNDVLFIDFPETNIFKELLIDQKYYRARIVLDRTNYTKHHILKMDYPNGVKYGIQSLSMQNLLKIKPEQIITSCDDIKDCSVHIKYNPNYSVDLPDAYDKKDFYYQNYEKIYEKLIKECPTIKDYN